MGKGSTFQQLKWTVGIGDTDMVFQEASFSVLPKKINIP